MDTEDIVFIIDCNLFSYFFNQIVLHSFIKFYDYDIIIILI